MSLRKRLRKPPSGFPALQTLVLVLFLPVSSLAPLADAAPSTGLQWLQVSGPTIVREDGIPVILRGANLPSLTIGSHAAASYDRFLDAAKSMGFNVARVPIVWAELEPAPGRLSVRYVNLIKEVVKLAEQREIYVVVDMHQYMFDGFPYWVTNRFRSIDDTAHGFWSDQSLQKQLIEAWVTLASSLKDERAVFAYDLLNEPYGGQIPWDRFAMIVNDFHSQLISEIRRVDPKHTILFEPVDICACTSIFGNQKLLRPQASNLAFSPHMYVRGPNKDLQYYSAALYNLSAYAWKLPVWVGEFGGVDVDVRDQNSLARLNTTLTIFGKYGLGWAYWQLEVTENGPQLVDAFGRASSVLTGIIARAVGLLANVNLPSPERGFAQVRVPTDSTKNGAASAAITLVVLSSIVSILVSVGIFSLRRYLWHRVQGEPAT